MMRLLAILAICLATLLSGGGAIAGDDILSAADANRRMEAGGLTLIDVRSPREWHQTGIPRGGAPVTIHDPDGVEGFVRHVLAAVGGDRDRPIAVICARGNRSTRAHALLKARGFTSVANVREGMLGRGDKAGWIASGLPLDRGAK